jgi:IBR domain, a half RING-finger domain
MCEHLLVIDVARVGAHETPKQAAKWAYRMKYLLRKEDKTKSEELAASKLVIAQTSKRCPKAGCQVPIQWKSNCPHITCKACKAEFCFLCKVMRKNGSPQHLRACPEGGTRVTKANLDLKLYGIGWDEDPGFDKTTITWRTII